MKAPICVICRKWVSVSDGTGSYVSFKPREIDEHMRFGHPDGWEMFCGEHRQIAVRYRKKRLGWFKSQWLTWDEARPLIEEAVEKANNPEGDRQADTKDLGE